MRHQSEDIIAMRNPPGFAQFVKSLE